MRIRRVWAESGQFVQIGSTSANLVELVRCLAKVGANRPRHGRLRAASWPPDYLVEHGSATVGQLRSSRRVVVRIGDFDFLARKSWGACRGLPRGGHSRLPLRKCRFGFGPLLARFRPNLARIRCPNTVRCPAARPCRNAAQPLHIKTQELRARTRAGGGAETNATTTEAIQMARRNSGCASTVHLLGACWGSTLQGSLMGSVGRGRPKLWCRVRPH